MECSRRKWSSARICAALVLLPTLAWGQVVESGVLTSGGGVSSDGTAAGSIGLPVVGGSEAAGLLSGLFHTTMDTISPKVVGGSAGVGFVTITFSETVRHASATAADDALNPANYAVECPVGTPVALSGAAVAHDAATRTTTISSLALPIATGFKVTVSNVRDTAGNLIEASRNSYSCTVMTVLSFDAGLRMVSLPFQLPDRTVGELLSEAPFATWDTAAASYVINSTELPSPGEGFWTQLAAATGVTVSQCGYSLVSGAFELTLPNAGFFILGNPFLDDMQWDFEQIQYKAPGADWKKLQLLLGESATWPLALCGWAYDGTGYEVIGDADVLPGVRETIRQNEALWIKTNVAGVQLRFPQALRRSRAAASVSRQVPANNGWTVDLQAQVNGLRSKGNVFGVVPAVGARGLMLPAPPPAPDAANSGLLRVSFVADGRQADAPRSSKVRLLGQSRGPASWLVEVATDQTSSEVTLTWPDLSRLPSSSRLWLTDLTTGTQRAMRSTNGYSFRTNAQGVTTRQLRIETTSASAAGLRLTSLKVTANRGGAYTLQYTASQPATVVAEFVSSSGRVVFRSASAQAQSGLNALVLSGRAPSGRALPRGVYVVRVLARDDKGQVAQAVTSVSLR